MSYLADDEATAGGYTGWSVCYPYPDNKCPELKSPGDKALNSTHFLTSSIGWA